MIADIGALLGEIIHPERVKTRLIDRVSYASDAGFYTLTPQAVVMPVDEKEVISLFQFSHNHNIPLVFRTGGTSLSGQSITDGILVDLSQHWDKLTIESDGQQVRVQPGITGAMVNSYLRPYKKKIGPDPASITAAMMGGILSNNSSGMCCGVALNSYHTLKYINFILPNGLQFNTENSEDYIRFEKESPGLFNYLLHIRTQLLQDNALCERIRAKYGIKNTIGYSINSFLDYEHPLDIFSHLLIGAEGTLAFIASAVLNTVPEYPHKLTALLYFTDIYSACQAITPLTASGARAVELMDRASLKAVEHMPELPEIIKSLPGAATALLVEFQEDSYELAAARVNSFLQQCDGMALLHAPVFTDNAKEQALYWKVRKGLFPSVGAVRKSGTTVILEDVAFPVDRLGDAIIDLQHLFNKFNYHNAIIFGHARDGNIHFLITPEFANQTEIDRYAKFMDEVAEVVLNKYDGALKAEHGTGRNMAPFVEAEWGGELYSIMQGVKNTADPYNLLNPGVIINNDKHIHLKHIKPLPTVEVEVDKCIECGYCEHKCPSRNITATPRRRIVVRRELENMRTRGDSAARKELLQQYQYDGLDTCAVDGLCATACPVDINTGDLIKRLRRENHSAFANNTALAVARNFNTVADTARTALTIGHTVNTLFGKAAMTNLTKILRKVSPSIPLWNKQLTKSPILKNTLQSSLLTNTASANLVYYPSCISRVMGGNKVGKKDVMITFLSVCDKAGLGVTIPAKVQTSCCSQIFSSKGYGSAQAYMSNLFIEQVWQCSNEGHLPIVIDVSSCAYTVAHMRHVLTDENKIRFDRLTILDCVEFLHDTIMPKLKAVRKQKSVVLHPVCSLQKMNTTEKFRRLAQSYALQVTEPVHAGCCGMAGDRGFLLPELTASATLPEALEVKQCSYDGYYSSTKTCEMAMSEAVGKNYESILYLIDEATA